jgi:hypothetical protein
MGKKIKTLRYDRGGEYLSHELSNHLKSCGPTPPLSPRPTWLIDGLWWTSCSQTHPTSISSGRSCRSRRLFTSFLSVLHSPPPPSCSHLRWVSFWFQSSWSPTSRPFITFWPTSILLLDNACICPYLPSRWTPAANPIALALISLAAVGYVDLVLKAFSESFT